jgi:hypothetical protein
MIPPKSASIAVKQAFFVGGRLTSASLLSRVAITVYIVDSKTLELIIYQVTSANFYITAAVDKQVSKKMVNIFLCSHRRRKCERYSPNFLRPISYFGSIWDLYVLDVMTKVFCRKESQLQGLTVPK